MPTIRLSTESLVYGYRQGQGFFAPLNLCCREGEITAILGANGRGKTTLLNTLMGHLSPLSGRSSGMDTLALCRRYLHHRFPTVFWIWC